MLIQQVLLHIILIYTNISNEPTLAVYYKFITHNYTHLLLYYLQHE